MPEHHELDQEILQQIVDKLEELRRESRNVTLGNAIAELWKEGLPVDEIEKGIPLDIKELVWSHVYDAAEKSGYYDLADIARQKSGGNS